ncbi:DUF2612 domain-containing protein [Burkholderia stagnalis]|uniref:DUF2612 domain-containing protein n=1 Tax=Burkholderia stagnalis TaxID=1503054 RepID=A0A108LKE9_9BURK|nr:DUF2612 domain-containing protein [Burkholderia stagnalis]KVZ03389.1 hypothetical protein WT35_28260 [Burkholderia stagnalis]KWA48397.1 hypothetical protein WT43_32575 [Burkholderia stagnalis]KWA51724.1 hypothetical protein WT42_16735 [Burkholderia stagnalis]KWA62705.1 hypothetical protein WT44_13835 [Burkholderia stagnalis]KWC98344.1 hypothetical protein WT46_23820 [Burkholderia stagnalis]
MSYERLLIWQYKGKPRATETARLIGAEIKAAWRGIAQLPEALDIDNAMGANLDLIGKHVGQSRTMSNVIERDGVGFLGALDDDDYRFLIRCRIAKNYMVGTVPDMMDALDFIFEGRADVFDAYDMTMSVVVNIEIISPFLLFAIKNLDVLPRPVGVEISLYIGAPERPFGFAGMPETFGFGDGAFTRYL